MRQLARSDHIIHAGDIGAPAVIDGLRGIAPTTAIRGNVDAGAWTNEYPDTEFVVVGRRVIYVLHNLKEITLDPAALGYTITVFAMVSLRSQAEADLLAFEEHVAGLPEVRECHMLNGEIDFILKVVARDLQSFQQFLTSQLTPAPNVASVKTSLTIRTSKALVGVPV